MVASGKTANQQLPYPQEADVPDIAGDMALLASAVEKQVVQIYSTVSAMNSAPVASLKKGTIGIVVTTSGTTTTAGVSVWNGSAWISLNTATDTGAWTPGHVPNFTTGTGAPSGGNDGDIYFKLA